jgi:hypothetical protein
MMVVSRNRKEESLMTGRKRKRGISLSNERGRKEERSASQLGRMSAGKEKSILVERFIIYDMNRSQWEQQKLQSQQLQSKVEAAPIRFMQSPSTNMAGRADLRQIGTSK